MEKKIYVYNFTNLTLIDSLDTCSNQLGLVSVSYQPDECVLACPDKEKGKVCVKIYSKDGNDPASIHNILEAHNS